MVCFAVPTAAQMSPDLLTFACAKIHGLEVAHDDIHFDELAKPPPGL
jgi:hypothetical protein